jgi:NAD(P)-dependent dehydrogenase (short-subunit alcohol dehydrogenase family)
VVADLDTTRGEQTGAAIKEAGGEAIFVWVDVTDPEPVEQMVRATIRAYGRLDIASIKLGSAVRSILPAATALRAGRR